jgi:glycerol-3-phosphate acyltransferase PlsY
MIVLYQFLWCLFAFFLGSLPLSLWTTRLMTGKDSRAVGDHNPGSVNALKTGGWRVGLPAFLLDVSKAAFPVGMAAYVFQWNGVALIFIALAPLFGSAFSPFLGFAGGKSLAVSLGIWIGLTLWQIPLVILPVLTLTFVVVNNSGFAVLVTLIVLGLYLFFVDPASSFILIYLVMAIILISKHRHELRGPFPLRGWVKRLLRRND